MSSNRQEQQMILHVAGFCSALAYAYLTFQSPSEGAVTLFDLWGVSLLNAVLCFGVWFTYQRNNEQPGIYALLGWALIFRLIGVYSFPVLEDDFYRFLWDGRMLVETGSPYLYAPSDFFDDASVSSTMHTVLDGINHPDIKTIYGPLAQYLFALSYLISPGESWPLQLLMAALDMVLIILLFKLAAPRSVLLYAWCPLVIKEFAFTGHPDIVALAPLVAALVAAQRRYFYSMSVLLAMAVCGKLFALILVPLLLRFHWRYWLVFISTTIALTLPTLHFPLEGTEMLSGLGVMASGWQFNAPLHQLMGYFLPATATRITLLVLFCCFWIIYAYYYLLKPDSRKPAGALPRGDWLFIAMLLCSPVLNPWYLIWVLPFAVIWPSYWAWSASVAILLAYGSGINLVDSGLALYQLPLWVKLSEFSIIALAWLWGDYLKRFYPSWLVP